MVTKEELSEKLNELLGTEDIDFTKLTKQELEKMYGVISRVAPLVEVAVRGVRNRVLSKPLGELIEEGPVRSILKGEKPLKSILKNIGREGGILGLLRGTERESEQES